MMGKTLERYLNNNQLTGRIPTSIGSLSSLVNLYVDALLPVFFETHGIVYESFVNFAFHVYTFFCF